MFTLRFFEIYRSEEYIYILLEGVFVTLSLSIISGVFGFIIAILIALIKFKKIFILNKLSDVFIEIIRNTPLIVQLFFITFGLPSLFGYIWPFWLHALLALVIHYSGYFAAIMYTGFLTISKSQVEAAKSLGIKNYILFTKILLPQVILNMYPSFCSQFIFIFLTTGLISEIGVNDLTHAGLYIDSRIFRSFEIFIVLTILYVLMALILRKVLNTFLSLIDYKKFSNL